MSNWAKDTRATIVPGLRYRDAPAAIEWLCRVFGFEKTSWFPAITIRLRTRSYRLATV